MDGEVLAALPGGADHGGLADVEGLLEDVEFAEAVVALLNLENAIEGFFMPNLDIPDSCCSAHKRSITMSRGDAGSAMSRRAESQ